MLDTLNLTHEQQQQAVEKIQQLMQQGINSGEAIRFVAEALRQQAKSQQDKQMVDKANFKNRAI
ncbi:YoaH family protein [Gallibacterium trehalosifermentans]|uniref:YoaH family protein n=1 Tax=Gallibacterium trehalosifermentans TaxID=516935 RepID=A0ABV6GYV8_9PAST